MSTEEREARDAEAEGEKEDRKFHWALWRLQRCFGVHHESHGGALAGGAGLISPSLSIEDCSGC